MEYLYIKVKENKEKFDKCGCVCVLSDTFIFSFRFIDS